MMVAHFGPSLSTESPVKLCSLPSVKARAVGRGTGHPDDVFPLGASQEREDAQKELQ